MISTPKITQMASGNLSLLITEDVTWESFPIQASVFLKAHRGIVLKRIDTPVERIWIVLVRWRPFWLAFDDVSLGMSLDSMSHLCNSVVRDIHASIKAA